MALLFALPQPARALSTAFTYQGQLLVNGNPFTGICPDLEFSLWDAAGSGSPPSGGNRIGHAFAVPDATVTNGVFTVQLDFGAQAFDGNDRWLQIGMNCAGPSAIMSPRQQLTATPYALYAASASDAADVTCSGCIGTGDLANGAVTATKIASGAIQPSNLAFTPGSITSITAGTGLTGGTITSSGTIGANIGTTAGTVAAGDHSHDSAYWKLGGNGGTNNLSTNFLGTTDSQPLEFRVNNTRALRLEPATTSPNIVGGYHGNSVTDFVEGGTIGGGGDLGAVNLVSAHYGTVSGGVGNTAGGNSACVGGGGGNTASSEYTTVGGGAGNTAGGPFASITGGSSNSASGTYSSVGGGRLNIASAAYATIAGGGPSNPTDPSNTNNRVTDNYGTIGGGGQNRAGNGDGDMTNALGATVGGGLSNSASANAATVAGGAENLASDLQATVAGGLANKATGTNSTICGGFFNTASGFKATVGGGASNKANGRFGVVGGGAGNLVTDAADFATIPGGNEAQASHYGEMAYASGGFVVDESGAAQTSAYVLRNVTTDATTKELFLDGVSQRITIASNRTLAFEALVVARALLGASAGYRIRGVVSNVGGGTNMVGATGDVLGEDPLATAWNAVAEADSFNDALVLKVNGAASTSIRWVAMVRTAEVAW